MRSVHGRFEVVNDGARRTVQGQDECSSFGVNRRLQLAGAVEGEPHERLEVEVVDRRRRASRHAQRVRFSRPDAAIVIRTADKPTSRGFVSTLPLTLTCEDFAGKEKVSCLSY
jgi:hypothetical protein